MDQFTKNTIEKDFKQFFNNIGRKKNYVGEILAIKARKLEGCILDINDTIPKFNMAPDPEYGIIKTKFRAMYENDDKVPIGTDRDFDTLFIIVLHKGKGTIEKVYAIPKKELDRKRAITIADNKDECQKFRIDEKPYNDVYCYMRTGKYSILKDSSISINCIGG